MTELSTILGGCLLANAISVSAIYMLYMIYIYCTSGYNNYSKLGSTSIKAYGNVPPPPPPRRKPSSPKPLQHTQEIPATLKDKYIINI